MRTLIIKWRRSLFSHLEYLEKAIVLLEIKYRYIREVTVIFSILSIVNLIKDSQGVQFASYFIQNSVYFYYYWYLLYYNLSLKVKEKT